MDNLVSDQSERAIGHEMTFRRAGYLIRRRWYVAAITGLLGVVITLGILKISKPTYTVSMVVAPVRSPSGEGGSSLPKLAGGLSSVLSGGGQSDTPFAYYRTELTSIAVAERLARSPEIMPVLFKWDPATRQFRSHTSLGGRLLGPIYRWLGIETASKPSAFTLRNYLKRALQIVPNTNDASLELTMNLPDPKFAELLLLSMHDTADELLRERAEARSDKLIGYLEDSLKATTDNTLSNSLTQLLLEQEKNRLLSQPGVAYAAEILDEPTASDLPTSPKPILDLPIGLIVGILVGFIYIILSDVNADARVRSRQ